MMQNQLLMITVTGALLCSTSIASAESRDLTKAIAVVASIEPGAAQHEAAKTAIETIEAGGADALVPLAKQIGQGNALADNWLRGAFEAIAADGISSVRPALIEFFKDRSNSARARRLVFETIVAHDPSAEKPLLKSAIDDPSEEMRVDAITQIVQAAENAETDEAKRELLEAALSAATVKEQVDLLAKRLESVGGAVDKKKHFGFLTKWSAVGPFDNKDTKGFDVLYGPEKADLSAPDLNATFEGTEGETTWNSVTAEGDDGVVNLAEQLAPHKGALVYVTTSFDSDDARDVELRLSTANAWKMWLNGEQLFEREEYHRGMHWDQYRVPAKLAKGQNVIVIKVLQNEQDQSWAQRWSYSLRVTDPTGRGLGELAAK